MINKSKTFAYANDSIKRTVGIDIRKAMGGKTVAEIAEDRLKNDVKQKASYNGMSGYQGVQIPVGSASSEQTPSKDAY